MENQTTTIPKWYWAVAVIFLLWNLMGVGSFFYHVFITEEALSALPIAEQDLYRSYPFWTKIAFAVAVFGGLAGCIGLLMKKGWARMAFIISLAGIIPQMSYDLFISNAKEVYGEGTEYMPISIIVVGVFLVWFSSYAVKKGWLRQVFPSASDSSGMRGAWRAHYNGQRGALAGCKIITTVRNFEICICVVPFLLFNCSTFAENKKV